MAAHRRLSNYGSEDKPRAVTELARFLAERLTDAGLPHLAKAA
ncbi:MAG TPA: hypothetical protein VLF65_03015 [Burkholderiales bacterium]|nr:hypothetical protein [Burkholderiales bacterium]